MNSAINLRVPLQCAQPSTRDALSRVGVAPRVAMAAMRHSSLDLTMTTYTDPRLLDVASALGVLPALPLEAEPQVWESIAQQFASYGRGAREGEGAAPRESSDEVNRV